MIFSLAWKHFLPFPRRFWSGILVLEVVVEAGAGALVDLRPEREVVAGVAVEPTLIPSNRHDKRENKVEACCRVIMYGVVQYTYITYS